MTHETDICIIGGGITSAMLAQKLSDLHLQRFFIHGGYYTRAGPAPASLMCETALTGNRYGQGAAA